MMEDLKKIVAKTYASATLWLDNPPPPVDFFQEKVEEAVQEIVLLSDQMYEQDREAGYEGYTEEADIGRYVWQDGESYISEYMLGKWVAQKEATLQKHYSPAELLHFEHYVVERSVLEVLRLRNGSSTEEEE